MTNQEPERAPIERLERIAAGIFACHGVDFALARRAGGWTNATWLAGGLALRLSARAGSDTIPREARLAALLPPEVGYPVSVAAGISDGFAWNLSKEVPGTCLDDVWPGLDWDERALVLRQVWEKAQAVHAVSEAQAAGLARERAWYNSTDAGEAEAGLTRLAAQRILTPRQKQVLCEALDRFWAALPGTARVLNHGDLTMGNLLYHQGQVVSLLDFEFAVTAPVELDVNSLVKMAFGPLNHQETSSEADCLGREKLRAETAALVRPLLAHPGGPVRLFGYAVLLELWLLELWLAHPDDEDGPPEQWEPYRRLLSLADGQGGYLAPLLHPAG